MKIQHVLIILVLSILFMSTGALAENIQPKHCDIHKTDATHDCAKHPGAKDQACAKHCAPDDSAAKAHVCNTPHCKKL